MSCVSTVSSREKVMIGSTAQASACGSIPLVFIPHPVTLVRISATQLHLLLSMSSLPVDRQEFVPDPLFLLFALAELVPSEYRAQQGGDYRQQAQY